MLKKAGFYEKLGKGSHIKWLHPQYPGRVTWSCKDGSDAKPYQEREAAEAIRIVMQQRGETIAPTAPAMKKPPAMGKRFYSFFQRRVGYST